MACAGRLLLVLLGLSLRAAGALSQQDTAALWLQSDAPDDELALLQRQSAVLARAPGRGRGSLAQDSALTVDRTRFGTALLAAASTIRGTSHHERQPSNVTAYFVSKCGMFCLQGDQHYAALSLAQLQVGACQEQYLGSSVVNGTCAGTGYPRDVMVEQCYPQLRLWFRSGEQGDHDLEHFAEPDTIASDAFAATHSPDELAALPSPCPRADPDGWAA
mmetsp:Transcript_19248/g.49345  ORF Transcript_19248/g.49345 Transcript_19248/m.49345 type:complete len:218 (-) Transcript_19248:74-727(-)